MVLIPANHEDNLQIMANGMREKLSRNKTKLKLQQSKGNQKEKQKLKQKIKYMNKNDMRRKKEKVFMSIK